jgi:carboxypeptidase Taq
MTSITTHTKDLTPIEQLEKLDQSLSALGFSEALIFWDSATLAPKNAVNGRSQTLVHLSEFYYNTLVNPRIQQVLEDLETYKNDLNDLEKSKLQFFREEYDKVACVPVDEYAAFKGLQALSSDAWEEAKEKNDFSIFEPYLQKVIDFQRKYIEYRNKGGHPYDTLLQDYERDLTVEIADQFFDQLRAVVVPLVQRIKDSGVTVHSPFEGVKYDVKNQKRLSDLLLEKLGFNKDSGIIAESVHPFTMNITKDDVRITTHYYEDNILSSIYSTIHECGHALYEQDIDVALGFSRLATGTTMGIHESQSRIYENNIGRSRVFWETYFPLLQDLYKDQLGDATPELCYKASNYVRPTLIRIEADELTYALHIMIRYELEKQIFEGKLNAKDLPDAWNDLYQNYLGITPDSDAKGVLQDVHWSEGLFGYFPSYALGSAYAAQFEVAMNRDFDVNKAIADDQLILIKNWLANKIHKYGSTKTPEEILLIATGEPFNPKYFTDYLLKKYSDLYNLG